nr:MAG TPA: hypothetical protein [Caudoviricetes sp.]
MTNKNKAQVASHLVIMRCLAHRFKYGFQF